jgi:3-oxoacyl-[acyl-carrier protein] reductase
MLWNVETGIKAQYEPGIMGIRGKTVVIVGNTAGLSQATAALLAQYGAPVFLAADSHTELSRMRNMIARVGGEADGMVVDLCRPEEVQRFFDQAGSWLGHIDAVVSFLTMESQPNASVFRAENQRLACQNMVMQEAIHKISNKSAGQIIYVGPARHAMTDQVGRAGRATNAARTPDVERNTAAALRRQAMEMGIRVTLIQPRAGSMDEPGSADSVLRAEDVAGYVLESLSQPFGVDVIYLPGQLEVD